MLPFHIFLEEEPIVFFIAKIIKKLPTNEGFLFFQSLYEIAERIK